MQTAAIDIEPILGTRINDESPCRACGSLVGIVSNGAGPHRGRIDCADCGRFRRWLPERIVAGMLEVTRLFGKPSTTIHPKEYIASSLGADGEMFLKPAPDTGGRMADLTQDDLDSIYGSPFFGGADFPKGTTMDVTVTKIEKHEFKNDSGAPERKAVLHFRESDKKLVLNKTNYRTLIEEFGRDPTRWSEEKITLCGEATQKGRGVRLRAARPEPDGSPF